MAKLRGLFAAIAAGGCLLGNALSAAAQPVTRTAEIAIDADDIAGVVTSENGPEAGVWVVAETEDLPTKFRKIVVTDDAGRYLLPDLPRATYLLWVRGYGLADSPRTRASSGSRVALRAVVAPSARVAAATARVIRSCSAAGSRDGVT